MSPDELTAAGLQYAVDGAVATITLNRPDVRNAQHPAMWAGLVRILEGLGDEVRVVVVRGAGGTFSAGLDLGLLDPGRAGEAGSLAATAQKPDQEIIDEIGTYQLPFAMLADPRFVSVAVVERHAIGAGFQLALSCDLRIAAEDAAFCMKEPALGLVPDLAGTKPLVAAVGYARALEICATARMVPAAEALALGLVQQVVPAAELDEATATLVGALTANFAGAVRATKALLREAPHRTLDEQRLAERTAQVGRFRELAKLMG
jgi:enoyl-CoA hydratase/carnithine racemase